MKKTKAVLFSTETLSFTPIFSATFESFDSAKRLAGTGYMIATTSFINKLARDCIKNKIKVPFSIIEGVFDYFDIYDVVQLKG